MATKQLAVPTIHPNGTSKQSLADELIAAYRGLSEPLKALVAAAPNGQRAMKQRAEAKTPAPAPTTREQQ